MKSFRIQVLVVLMTLLAACSGGCAGTKARSDALFPAVASAWPRIGVTARAEMSMQGVNDLQIVDSADAAIAAKSVAMMRKVPFDLIEQYASSGLDRRFSAPGSSEVMATKLRRHLDLFTQARKKLTQEMPQ